MVEQSVLAAVAREHSDSLLPAPSGATGRAWASPASRRQRAGLGRLVRVQHLSQLDQGRPHLGLHRADRAPGGSRRSARRSGSPFCRSRKTSFSSCRRSAMRLPEPVEGFLVFQRQPGGVVAGGQHQLLPDQRLDPAASRRCAGGPGRCSARPGRSRPGGSGPPARVSRARQHFRNASWAASWASSRLPSRYTSVLTSSSRRSLNAATRGWSLRRRGTAGRRPAGRVGPAVAHVFPPDQTDDGPGRIGRNSVRRSGNSPRAEEVHECYRAREEGSKRKGGRCRTAL